MAYGIKADCWALGCIMYSLVAGGPPFDCHGDIKQTVENIKCVKIKYPDHINPELYDLLKKIFIQVNLTH